LDHSALGLVECRSLALGALVADGMLKTAGVHLLLAAPVSPGKLLVAIQGGVAEVEAALEKGLALCEDQLEDALFLPRVHPAVGQALLAPLPETGVEAMGVVETATVAASLRAADASLKSARVELLSIRLGAGIGGKAVYHLAGEIADVEAAVQAGVSAVRIPELLLCSVVLARPHPDYARYMNGGPGVAPRPAGTVPPPEV